MFDGIGSGVLSISLSHQTFNSRMFDIGSKCWNWTSHRLAIEDPMIFKLGDREV